MTEESKKLIEEELKKDGFNTTIALLEILRDQCEKAAGKVADDRKLGWKKRYGLISFFWGQAQHFEDKISLFRRRSDQKKYW